MKRHREDNHMEAKDCLDYQDQERGQKQNSLMPSWLYQCLDFGLLASKLRDNQFLWL
jgi:hypothetical protein